MEPGLKSISGEELVVFWRCKRGRDGKGIEEARSEGKTEGGRKQMTRDGQDISGSAEPSRG